MKTMARNTPRDIEAAIEELGIQITRITGDEIHARCPQHEYRTGKPDRSPSWSVNRDKGWHLCFSCGYGGTFLDLVMDVAGLDVFYAHRWIRKHGVLLVDPADMPDYYEEVIEETRKPSRKLGEADLALFYLPPQGPLERRGITREACEFYDILWDIENLAWIIPIRRPDGELIGWQAKNKHFYDNFPYNVPKGDCVFGLEQLQEGETAIVEESPLDCLRLRTAGVTGGVSTYGVHFTDKQIKLILDKTDSVVVAYDNDKDGRLSTRKMLMGEEKRGQVTHRGWATRFRESWIVNYGDLNAKDHGEMTDFEILWSLENKFTVADIGFGRVQNRSRDDNDTSRRTGTRNAPPRSESSRVRRGGDVLRLGAPQRPKPFGRHTDTSRRGKRRSG